ncbi:MAG: papain-like cysteine protease family protein [Candidatus Aquilonibacter sp.]|jgi:hypothetical protein
MQSQAQTDWCWSANAVSAAAYYNSNQYQQCTLVNTDLNQTTCCTNGNSQQCNVAWYLDRALTTVGCNYNYSSGQLDRANVLTELQAGYPIEVRIGWNNGAGDGHFCAIVGYDSAQDQLHIEDPWYGPSHPAFNDFCNNYQSAQGKWTDTFVVTSGPGGAAPPPGGAAGGGQPPPGAPQGFANTYALAMQAEAMPNRTTPVYTISLKAAAAPSPLQKMTHTGDEQLSDAGVRVVSAGAQTSSLRLGGAGQQYARQVLANAQRLTNERVLKIPSLLITAVVGKSDDGSTVIHPIDRIPPYLVDRDYTAREFENVLKEQAQLKQQSLKRLNRKDGVF